MPQNEIERLKSVQRFLNLEINKKDELQEIAELAAELCEMPIAIITLIDENTQYFKFKAGPAIDQNLREDTFCEYLIDGNELTVVENVLEDIRFVNNPYVTGDPLSAFMQAPY